MRVSGDNRLSRLAVCLDAAHNFLLSREEAGAIALHQVRVIGHKWEYVCTEAGLTETDRALLWGCQFLNPFAFEGLDGDAFPLRRLANDLLAGRGTPSH